MQVFGLPAHMIRNGRAAPRLLEAKTPSIEAARRRGAVQRWREAMAAGLTGERAATAVGVPRATLCRWEKKPGPLSRRPHRPRGRQWASALARAVEELRRGNPMWGKRKIAVLLRREGFSVSVSTAGRILAHLVKRGAAFAVPILRRRPAARRIRLTAKERDARRLPKGRKAKSPGEIGQIDTLFVNIRPDKPIKHFTACDPVAKWAIGRVSVEASALSAKSLLDKLLTEAPFPVRGIQVDGGAEFKSVFEAECQARGLALFVLPPKRPDLNGCVERAQSSWRYEFYATYELPHRIDKLRAFADAFAHKFNHHRPHGALGGQTPAEYLPALSQGSPTPSHRYMLSQDKCWTKEPNRLKLNPLQKMPGLHS